MILITGGAGYIGSHTCVELLNAQYDIVVVDNFSNSKPEVLNHVKEITNTDFITYEYDILDKESLEKVFSVHKIEAVIHLAGLKAVDESIEMPLKYYYNNITGTLLLCEVMQKHGVKSIVFSSSATVYGTPDKMPITEEYPLNAINPYGRTKLIIEELLSDLYLSDPSWSIINLRYFNPIGAHESGNIGEDPTGIPNNLMPYITQVAAGLREKLSIYGCDYNTHDGTAVRDYIHVMDIANGHAKALNKLMSSTGIEAYNLGTGIGYSVLDLVKSFEKVTQQKIPYTFTDRRKGDSEKVFADPRKANKELNWIANRGLEEMCRDSWKSQIMKIRKNKSVEW
jgi:UDP-glucose 4-epimerase